MARAADVGGADALAVVVKQGHDVNAEAELGSELRQRRRRTSRARAKGEVLPHHDVFRMQAPHKEVCHVFARLDAPELLREIDDEHGLDAHFFRQLHAALKCNDGQRRALRKEHRNWVRIEGHHDRTMTVFARVLDGLRHELLVAAV